MKPIRRPPRTQISILVPFQTDDAWRRSVWHWLRRYLKASMPDVEIILGDDPRSRPNWRRRKPIPFSKTTAVNRAFRKSHGDIIVILDADAYLDMKVVQHCADRIRDARTAGSHLWFVPYLWIYRLTEAATKLVLTSKPHDPYTFTSPPPKEDIEGTDGSGWGRKFGALCMIMPREAFVAVGGMDERFRGWGGEDVSFLKALDKLWGKHSNTPNDILHLWHRKIIAGEWNDGKGNSNAEVRAWAGQDKGKANDWLSHEYHKASGSAESMRALVDEGKPKGWFRRIK